jgi:hypothetical protein
MQTTEFTWRPFSQKSSGSKLPVVAFVMGLVIAHYWHVSGNQSEEHPASTVAVVKTAPQKSELSTSDHPSPVLPRAAETNSFGSPEPVTPAAADSSVVLAPSSALVSDHSPRPTRSYSTPPDHSPKKIEPAKRQRSASTRKYISEPDYAALREFLLNR